METTMLITKFLRDELTDQERAELQNWVDDCDNHRVLFEDLTCEAALKDDLKIMYEYNRERSWQKIVARLT